MNCSCHKKMTAHLVSTRFGIICDQVRREDNGKLLIIGVYGHNISVSSFPAHLQLSVVVGTWSKEPLNDCPMEARATFDGTEIYSGKGMITINEPGADIMVVPNIIVSAHNEGELEIKIRLGSGRWKAVASIPIRARS